MAVSDFVTTKVSVGLYLNPKTIFEKAEALAVYQRLLEFPEFDGFSTYSPPQPFTQLGTTLGTLTSSNNLMKCEIGQTAVLLHWSNVTHAGNYDLESDEVENLVTRILKPVTQKLGAAVVYREFVVKAVKERVESLLAAERRRQLKGFFVTLTYPGKVGEFEDLDIGYTLTDAIADEAWTTAFPDHKYSLSGNTSMRFDPERVLTLEQINAYLAQALREQTGPKLLADITDGGE